ncbi:hypothetical protein KL86PLE_100759 [uncultured Pleomorphomonas sp.]|uniref:Uncharacterized protein n=1 Tax=uncultured Pleomorphomonas sp. TaxID=442121 RepID=A0A212L5V9_9HYPH|nr:hypothetical protein KL86PLE_100759 [uncultured Pleomorphomonas sp.]
MIASMAEAVSLSILIASAPYVRMLHSVSLTLTPFVSGRVANCKLNGRSIDDVVQASVALLVGQVIASMRPS